MSARGLAIALFISMALNLFAVGAVVGGFVVAQRLHGPPGRAGGHQQPLWAAADGLSPEHRQAYRTLLRGQAVDVAQQVREARMARRRAWEGLAAEPFDAAVATRNLADARNLEMQARGGVEDRIVQFAATLTPAERAKLAEGLARGAPGAHLLRRVRGGGPDGPPQP